MKQCCGHERDSAFCPDCGERLVEAHPLAALLEHVQSRCATLDNQVLRQANAARQGIENAKKGEASPEYFERLVAQNESQRANLQAAREKWDRWAMELANLIVIEEADE